MLPSSSDLSYFVEIAQQKNLTRAAARLGVSQPSLTLAIQRLEQSVGTSLLIRTRQGVSLTKAGERLLIEARQLIGIWEDLRTEAVSSMNEVRGRFTLGCHPSVAHYSLPLFLPDMLHAHPQLEIALHHDLSRNVAQKVLHLELDLGIVVNPPPHADLVMRPLTKDVVTMWQTKRCKNPDVLIIEPSLLQTQSLLNKIKRSGFDFKRIIESSNLEVIAGLTDCGAGIGVLPARVAHAHSKQLTSLKNAPVIHDEIFLVYRVENKAVRSIQALSQSIQEGFSASRL